MPVNNKYKLAIIATISVVVALVALLLTQVPNIQVLNPQGLIASRERDLIILATALMLLVVIPVFIMTAVISIKYRAGNTKSRYTPDADHHLLTELGWWAFPSAIISILAVVAWQSSHDLDPFKPIDSPNKPVTIQVVALQWKWLFIYPEQNIASVNLVEFPKDTPINFVITSDAPMNSFWIPKLGGQVYAMSGMSTQLHLIASEAGDFPGSSANISGAGFSSMSFTARSAKQEDFNDWVQLVRKGRAPLTSANYEMLAQPSQANPVTYYSSVEEGIYNNLIMKYMMPMPQTTGIYQRPATSSNPNSL